MGHRSIVGMIYLFQTINLSSISQDNSIESYFKVSKVIIRLYSQGIQTGSFKHSKVNVETTYHHKSRICVFRQTRKKEQKKMDGWTTERQQC